MGESVDEHVSFGAQREWAFNACVITIYVFLQYPEELRAQMRESIKSYYGIREGEPYYDKVTDTWDRIQENVRQSHGRVGIGEREGEKRKRKGRKGSGRGEK